MVIRNEQNTNIWYDTWLHKTIRQQIQSPLLQIEEERTIDSIIRNNRNYNYWFLDDLPFQLPQNICLEILSQPTAQNILPPKERQIWKLTTNDIFTSKSTYHHIIKHSDDIQLLDLGSSGISQRVIIHGRISKIKKRKIIFLDNNQNCSLFLNYFLIKKLYYHLFIIFLKIFFSL